MDYKLLHTSGERVIKPVKMTERLIQNDLDCVDELDAFIEDNNIQDLDEIVEATETLNKFEKIVARYNECHTELKLALGDKYQTTYGGRTYTATSRRYMRDLKTRSKELRKLERQNIAEQAASAAQLEELRFQQAAEERKIDSLRSSELEKLKLQQAAEEKDRDRQHAAALAVELEKLKLQQA
ncbi:MAG: hypothetical protein ABGX53_06520, partial [Candidatus Thioglobus sp.]